MNACGNAVRCDVYLTEYARVQNLLYFLREHTVGFLSADLPRSWPSGGIIPRPEGRVWNDTELYKFGIIDTAKEAALSGGEGLGSSTFRTEKHAFAEYLSSDPTSNTKLPSQWGLCLRGLVGACRRVRRGPSLGRGDFCGSRSAPILGRDIQATQHDDHATDDDGIPFSRMAEKTLLLTCLFPAPSESSMT